MAGRGPCPFCLDDESLPVGDVWELLIERSVKSKNAFGYSPYAGFWYRTEVEKWASEIADEMERLNIYAAEGKRRAIFTRLMGPNAREMDHFNLVAGLNPVVDAMVELKLLVDDKPRWFVGHAHQERHPLMHALRIKLMEL